MSKTRTAITAMFSLIRSKANAWARLSAPLLVARREVKQIVDCRRKWAWRLTWSKIESDINLEAENIVPSIINRVGVVENFGEETGGDAPASDQPPVEVKSTNPPKTAPARKPKTTKQR